MPTVHVDEHEPVDVQQRCPSLRSSVRLNISQRQKNGEKFDSDNPFRSFSCRPYVFLLPLCRTMSTHQSTVLCLSVFLFHRPSPFSFPTLIQSISLSFFLSHHPSPPLSLSCNNLCSVFCLWSSALTAAHFNATTLSRNNNEKKKTQRPTPKTIPIQQKTTTHPLQVFKNVLRVRSLKPSTPHAQKRTQARPHAQATPFRPLTLASTWSCIAPVSSTPSQAKGEG